MNNNSAYLDIIEITYLTPDNAKFKLSKNGFLMLEAYLPPVKKDDLDESAEGEENAPVWQELGRVFLHRAFPFDMKDEFISVLDKDGREYGVIRNLNLFDRDVREMLDKELARKYFSPEIKKIKSLKERFGYSYWEVETNKGDMSFAVHDTFRNIARISENRIVITDVDGNRYDIFDVMALDSRSYRKIELYL